MSHVTCSVGAITDLDCVEAILPRYPKLKLLRNQKSYPWFGSWQDDFDTDAAAYHRGIDVSQYGHCDHALELQGCKYGIGLTKRKDGEGWSLVWDQWGQGHRISEYLGEDAGKFMADYEAEYHRRYGLAAGFISTTTDVIIDGEEYYRVELSK